jgi:1-acyl-sn-glycerol-3-phosphate acyltransferase
MLAYSWFIRRRGVEVMLSRIAWMQWMSCRLLSVLNCKVTLVGGIPVRGLIACNHLGYVDILVIGSVCPAIFVAKSDVQKWPVFGWLAAQAGSIFVSRNEPAKVASQLREIELPLRAGLPVVLFPEGTSSDGTSVLPFLSSLFESAISTGSSITPAAIAYHHVGVDVGSEVAYWGDLVLVPHLLNLLAKESFTARLSFGSPRALLPDRKNEAIFLHQQVSQIHQSLR